MIATLTIVLLLFIVKIAGQNIIAQGLGELQFDFSNTTQNQKKLSFLFFISIRFSEATSAPQAPKPSKLSCC